MFIMYAFFFFFFFIIFFFQAEDGIRDLVRSRGLGDVYKRQIHSYAFLSMVTPDGIPSSITET